MIGVVLVVISIGLFLLNTTASTTLITLPPTPATTSVPALVPVGPILPAASPMQLEIPRLGLVASFGPVLGLASDGTIEVPDNYEEVGWYRFGPTPGELGPAVVLGHVDSEDGPAVFFSLGQLTAGDEILITRADVSVATFAVTGLERPRQAAFPIARVYGDIDHAGLRLITCSGQFVRGQQRYTHNLIVYARLIE